MGDDVGEAAGVRMQSVMLWEAELAMLCEVGDVVETVSVKLM